MNTTYETSATPTTLRRLQRTRAHAAVAGRRTGRPAYPDLAAVERELDLLTRMCA